MCSPEKRDVALDLDEQPADSEEKTGSAAGDLTRGTMTASIVLHCTRTLI
ncbi:hypothetical protein X946_5097 [Burkholderia sp. ABCPW 111]|nr:hypothetical protein X946_5097 [Burkholderia sp. ABCPW 111]